MKNLQGDIIAITNKNGKTVAEYSYDAWGVPTILSDSTGVIANANPFRYRSYYFDVETSLYYLQSRYYDASVGRFVNEDTPSIVCNSNRFGLFAYCSNAPINLKDPSGFSGTLAILSAVLGVGSALLVILLMIFSYAYICDKDFRYATNQKIASIISSVDRAFSALISFVVDLVSNIKMIPIYVATVATMGFGYLVNVVTEIAEYAATRRRYKQTQDHHIVAKADARAVKSREILENNYVSIHSRQNIVTISNTLHRHLHTNSYHVAVELTLRRNTEKAKTRVKKHLIILTTLEKIAGILTLLDICIR